MTPHTPEPWKVSEVGAGEFITTVPAGPLSGKTEHIATVQYKTSPCWAADAARIVSCVNYCAGINPEAIADLLTLARYCDKPGDTVLNKSAIVGMARAALRKATGLEGG